MKRLLHGIAFLGIMLVLLNGCSSDSAIQTRYEMEKLVFDARKISERINIAPELSTQSDSLQFKQALKAVLDFYYEHRDDPEIKAHEEIETQLEEMAVAVQTQLASYFVQTNQPDSVIAAFRTIGSDIDAGEYDIAGATLALALTYRSLRQFDSTYVLYDRVLQDYYPPVDSLGRLNRDVIGLPIDKLRIALSQEDTARVERFTREALEYYTSLREELPDNDMVVRSASLSIGRVYSLTKQWQKAIAELEQVKDTTGRTDVRAITLVAGIYEGPLEQPRKAIELYESILNRRPDSAVVGNTMLRLGAALCRVGELNEGRQVLADLKKKFSRYGGLMSGAQKFYAQAFEAEGRWDRALSEYQWLMENYPYSDQAYWAALYIPERFKREGDEKLAEIWYDRAIDFYDRAARVQQGQPVGIEALKYLSDVYRRLGQWNETLETLDRLAIEAANTTTGAQALLNAARVAYINMEDSVQAQAYLDRLQQSYGTDTASVAAPEPSMDNGIDIESLE